ncbi:hypothetical protein DH09_01065 (plasmid) [Bacillaceae bacterium JMAK1]|nr:hypothetical protein DH09_01065 [Bacillaceae bacterium JMAK1]
MGFIGVFTVIIGNISEAIAGVKELNGILAEELFEFGAIAQAVGSILGVLSFEGLLMEQESAFKYY